MNRFWGPIIRPCLERIKAKSIVEVGSQFGDGTKKIIQYCKENQGFLASIDPFPQFDVKQMEEENNGYFKVYQDLSLSRLPLLTGYDAILVDGDHNWYTVYHELKTIGKTFKDKAFPLIFLHDVGWPYGKRDLYYNPDNIPLAYRQPYDKKGMLPEETMLAEEGGINPHLCNAIYENNLQNGVMTAVEDFLEEMGADSGLELMVLPVFHGLAILLSKEIHQEVFMFLQRSQTLLTVLTTVERERIDKLVLINKHKKKMADQASVISKLKDKLEGKEAELTQAAKKYAEEMDAQVKLSVKYQESLAEKDAQMVEQNRVSQVALEEARKTLEVALQESSELQTRYQESCEIHRQVQALYQQSLEENQVLQSTYDSLLEKYQQTQELQSTYDCLLEKYQQTQELQSTYDCLLENYQQTQALYEQSLAQNQESELHLTEIESEYQYRLQQEHLAVLNTEHQFKLALQQMKLVRESMDEERKCAEDALHQILSQTQVELKQAKRKSIDLNGERKRYKELAKRAGQREAIHLNSVRYRIGDAIIKALRPSLDTLKLPVRLFRLLREGLGHRKARKTGASYALPVSVPASSSGESSQGVTAQRVVVHPVVSASPSIPQMKRMASEIPEYIRTVDVVVCVHNALDDTKECIASLLENNTFGYHVILVDDGSATDTEEYLKFAAQAYGFDLIRNETAKGYTVAANLGLHKSTADYVVLLNSDTIVTDGWIEKMVQLFDREGNTGIISPLSNAASWQTVPDMKSGTDWKVNVLPEGMTVQFMNRIVELSSEHSYPKVSVLNGFCFMISRTVIHKIGYLDEEVFPTGYGEENDYCIRAKAAGFDLRVLDDTYIFHEKSKSFGHETRKHLSKAASGKLRAKHGEHIIDALTADVKDNPYLNRIRETIQINQDMLWKRYAKLQKKRVVFILPTKGGGGGANSVVQELYGMRKLGFDVWLLNKEKYRTEFDANYPEIKHFIRWYVDDEDAVLQIQSFDLAIATIFHSVDLLHKARLQKPSLIPMYYAQDYEPYFFDQKKQGDMYQQAYDSYTLIPDNHIFAKTDWIREEIKKYHGVEVAKVQPSLDTKYYNPFRMKQKVQGEKIVISAMVRFSTPRRQPFETIELLKQIKASYQQQVEIVIFGSAIADFEAQVGKHSLDCTNLGIIKRWEVADLLVKSDLFIDFSTYQAFGRTGLESMAMGCVPVLPKWGGVYEYAEDGKNALIVDTTSKQEAFHRICTLLDQKEALSSYALAGLQTAKGYSVGTAAWSELNIMSDIVNGEG